MSNTPSDKPQGAAALREARAQHRRALLETRLSLISVGAFLFVFAAIAIFLLVFPRSTKSQIENRNLAEFPTFSLESYFSGDFTASITTFYDDTVPYHDSFKNMSNQIKSSFGMRLFSTISTAAENNEDSGEEAEATPTPSPTPDPYEGVAGREILSEFTQAVSAADEPYQRDYSAEENSTLEWVNNLLMVNWDGHWPAPTSSAIYTPKNALEYVADQSECFDNIAAKLNDGIRSVNVVDVMKKHTEENIYLRTDHHWQPLGAYYAARTFAEAAGVPFADLTMYEKGVNEGYVGTMYGFSQDSRLLNDPEDFEYYVPRADYQAYYYDASFNYLYSDDLFAEVDTANSYVMFLGGDNYVVKVDTGVTNGRKLLVVKDSYGNAEIPFYTSSFEQIYVLDVRYFERNLVNFIEATGVTDVLFTMSAYSVVSENADNITKLINQDADSTITDEHPTGAAAVTATATPTPSPSPEA